MSFVFVVDTNKKPLDPVHPGEARYLLKAGKAAILKRYPFTIILKKALEHPSVQPLHVKLDPGSRTTGIALLDDTTGKVLFAAELTHRGQVEHIIPRAKGGSNRVRNLALACESCNQEKGTQDIAVFLAKKPDVLKRILATAKAPLKDAAAVNSTRWRLFGCLKELGLPVECGSGGRTKFNRITRNLPKTHWLDACCVGKSTPEMVQTQEMRPLLITATGHARRQMCVSTKYGFPKQHKPRHQTFLGYRTGDVVKAITPKITVIGRIAIRHRPSFRIGKHDIHPKYMHRVHRADGYTYA
ncbi:MAG: RRXRR domain-containing protein [Ktedonobacteraceae bacterium]|nr:RRXRR domain-containing protein [Ktedonobacteraceae bacterium]